jgi:hypothetical protein
MVRLGAIHRSFEIRHQDLHSRHHQFVTLSLPFRHPSRQELNIARILLCRSVQTNAIGSRTEVTFRYAPLFEVAASSGIRLELRIYAPPSGQPLNVSRTNASIHRCPISHVCASELGDALHCPTTTNNNVPCPSLARTSSPPTASCRSPLLWVVCPNI